MLDHDAECRIMVDRYTHEVYSENMKWLVVLNPKLEKEIRKPKCRIPEFILVQLFAWQQVVEEEGLDAARRIPGYNDESLKGKLQGQRSIRLSKGWRAYYVVQNGEVSIITIERIDKHEY